VFFGPGRSSREKLFGACSPGGIDYLLLCRQSPDHFLPTTSCLLPHRRGISIRAGALDFNLMGCSGFVYGLGLAQGLIQTGPSFEASSDHCGDVHQVHSPARSQCALAVRRRRGCYPDDRLGHTWGLRSGYVPSEPHDSVDLASIGCRLFLADIYEKGKIWNVTATGLTIEEFEQPAGDTPGDGYYHTGDLASRDADRYITFIGRKDDVFKASDYRVSPFELESALIEHPAVAEAAVVPSPHPMRLAVPKAFIVLRAGYEPRADVARELFGFMRQRLAPYKRVRRMEFTELPKTISGKIRRAELRKMEQNRSLAARKPQEFFEEDF
jgi:hypothetical protein